MAKRLALTIAGAVSLGSYEAGVLYEILNAIAQHNDWADNANQGKDRIEIDVLTGASAGGMTAAIAAYNLLFDGSRLNNPYDNPLYNAWVRDIDIEALLSRRSDEDVSHSVLSSDLIVDISRKYLATPPPTPTTCHPALPKSGTLNLGLAMSNLNGVDYARPTLTGREFIYTLFADQRVESLSQSQGYLSDTWEAIRATAVSCGAFPIAFRVQDIVRNLTEFSGNPFLIKTPWGGNASTVFTYTDGGVFQNEPLGMAANLVQSLPGGRLDGKERGYLFIAPKPKASDSQRTFSAKTANYKELIVRLFGAVIGQSEFRDWVMAESFNDAITLLNNRALQLQQLYANETLLPAQTTPITDKLLNALFSAGTLVQQGALDAARKQLQSQYSTEYSSFSSAGVADAWRDALLVLEMASNLHDKEEMYIYDFVADPTNLAGGQLFAFTGFFDVEYRKHDYDYGRSVGQDQLRMYAAKTDTVFYGLHWTPGNINPINPAYNNLPMKSVDLKKRQRVYTQLMSAVDALLSELGANWIERKAAELFLIRKYVRGMLAL